MCAASSSCFSSAVYKGGLRLSACLTEINSHSAGEEDAGILCVGYGAVSCQAGAQVSTRSTWRLCPCPMSISAQLQLTSEDVGSKQESYKYIREEKGWLAAAQNTDGCSKEATCWNRLDWVGAASCLTSQIREPRVGEREAALEEWVSCTVRVQWEDTLPWVKCVFWGKSALEELVLIL